MIVRIFLEILRLKKNIYFKFYYFICMLEGLDKNSEKKYIISLNEKVIWLDELGFVCMN